MVTETGTRGALAGQILRFGIVGICATAVHVCAGLMAAYSLGLAPLASNLVGFCCAVLVSFLGHALFTFRVATPTRRHFLRFFLVALMSLVASSAITAISEQNGGSFALSMACVAVVIPGLSFVASKLWAFADAPAKKV